MMPISDKKINGCGAHVEYRESVGVDCGDGINNKVTEKMAKCGGDKPCAEKPHIEGVSCGGLNVPLRNKKGGPDTPHGPRHVEEGARRFEREGQFRRNSAPCATAVALGTSKPRKELPVVGSIDGGHREANHRPGQQGEGNACRANHDNMPHGDEGRGDKPHDGKPRGDKHRDNKHCGDKPRGDRPCGDQPRGDNPCDRKPRGGEPNKLCGEGHVKDAPRPRDGGSPPRDHRSDIPRCGGDTGRDHIRGGQHTERPHTEGSHSEVCEKLGKSKSCGGNPHQHQHDSSPQRRGAGPSEEETRPPRGGPHHQGHRRGRSPSDEPCTRDGAAGQGGSRDGISAYGRQPHADDIGSRGCHRAGGDGTRPNVEISCDGGVDINRQRCQVDRPGLDVFGSEGPQTGRCSRPHAAAAADKTTHERRTREDGPREEGRRGKTRGSRSPHSVTEKPRKDEHHNDDPRAGGPHCDDVPSWQTRDHDDKPSHGSPPRGDKEGNGKPRRLSHNGESPAGAKPRCGGPHDLEDGRNAGFGKR
jgi:hypothetical protein